MSTIVTRSGKGSPLTHTEVDANFTNLNADKYQEGSAIGAVTPAAGTFTTLTATGQTSLGGAAGSESFRAVPVTSSVNYVTALGSTGTNPSIRVEGSDPNINLALSSKGASTTASNIRFYTNNLAQEQLRVSHTASAVNYVQVTGAATTKATVISSQGSDSNISQVFQSKGTGAIDLAAGSSGVNISNGGTVTAITVTASGSGYTTIPSLAITAPTTAGGVQATATPLMFSGAATIGSGGTGYTVGDVLLVTGGTYSSQASYTVATVSAGVVTSVTRTTGSGYSVLPTNPASTTGGTGTGCTLNATWTIGGGAPTITNAGSGYVEQPTVTFSGGGGSGAAAYATVGSGTRIQTLGNPLSFYTPSGEAFRVSDIGVTSAAYWTAYGGSSIPELRSSGAGIISVTGANALQFRTNVSTQQFNIAHTASAVNYVQITGSATGNRAGISSQGSDTNIGLSLSAKGTGNFSFGNTAGSTFAVINSSSSAANYAVLDPANAGSSPVFRVAGSDTNIDLTLTPKGTGRVKFGTYTASILTPTGYVEIVDSGGTVRRLLVG